MRIDSTLHKAGAALLRVVVGVIFLWAGLAKLLGAGAEGWTAAGFLRFGTGGTLGWPFVSGEPVEGAVYNPTQAFWVGLADDAALMTIVNALVIYGQIAIGVALILGLFTRFAATMGALQMGLFFFAAWEFAHGIANQHLTYALIALAVAGLGAGRYYGLDGYLAGRVAPFVRRYLMSGEPAPEPTTPPAGAPAPA